jgi:hypothetical protein
MVLPQRLKKAEDNPQPAMIWCFGLDIEEAEKVEQQ